MTQQVKQRIVLGVFILYLLVIVGSQFIVHYHDAMDVHLNHSLAMPNFHHWLGTDEYGRDMLSRIIVGARYTLLVSLLTLMCVLIIGLPLGLVAGYKQGWLDTIIMRILDIGLSIPDFVLMIALASFFKPSIWNLVIAITLIKWMNYTRLSRNIVKGEINKPYIKMAKLLHVPNRVIIIRHILPKVWPAMTVLLIVDFGKIILYISSLSFLGLGAQPPSAEWGAMLNAGRDYIESNPLLMIAPAVMITITILIFNFVGDAIQDYLLDNNRKRDSNE